MFLLQRVSAWSVNSEAVTTHGVEGRAGQLLPIGSIISVLLWRRLGVSLYTCLISVLPCLTWLWFGWVQGRCLWCVSMFVAVVFCVHYWLLFVFVPGCCWDCSVISVTSQRSGKDSVRPATQKQQATNNAIRRRLQEPLLRRWYRIKPSRLYGPCVQPTIPCRLALATRPRAALTACMLARPPESNPCHGTCLATGWYSSRRGSSEMHRLSYRCVFARAGTERGVGRGRMGRC